MRSHTSTSALFKGRHFEQEIIILCVRWYLRYKLSYRDLVGMMAERGLPPTRQSCVGFSGTHRSSTNAGAASRRRLAPPGGWTRPTSGSAASGLISTGLSTRLAIPSTFGSARGATSLRPRHSFVKPYVLKAGHPRLLRWTVMPLPTVPFANFKSRDVFLT